MRRLIFLGCFLTSLLYSEEKEIVRSDTYECPYPASKEDTPYWKRKDRAQKTQNNFLFILHAKDGHLQAVRENMYELTLYQVDPHVTFFSELPHRKGGKMNMEKFLQNAMMGQKGSPAGLITVADFHQSSSFNDLPLILDKPVYHEKSRRLVFEVRVEDSYRTVKTGDLGETTLYIDRHQY